MPEANEMVVGIMAVVAQAERRMISEQTKAALAAAKERGVKLGGDRGNLAAVGARGRSAGSATSDRLASSWRALGGRALRYLSALRTSENSQRN